MYEPVSHALLNDILDDMKPELRQGELRHFFTRLGANFYAIFSLFQQLYGHREDMKSQMVRLVEVLASRYLERANLLKEQDRQREQDSHWFLHQQWVGMALYADGFAGHLAGVRQHLPYLQDLGINMVHVMPMMTCPPGKSDGGYAVSNYREIDPRIGTLDELRQFAKDLRQRDILLVLDVVVNHTSSEHEWAKRARSGDEVYQQYYYTFPDRDIPDLFEETMPEIFPDTSPGNFTFDPQMNRWVMTVFNTFQWDLNYTNPAVLIELVDVILFWANTGADIVRLDAVAFLWKKIGTTCQNLHEAHQVLQLMKDCCQVTAPGILFIAEAIVAPVEITKYFGEDAVIAKECEIAYNATLMALLWDAVATKNAKLLHQGVMSLPQKLDNATWLNYLRSHDDIGLGFDDLDIQQCGYDPSAHRQFLLHYFTGVYPGSDARGQPFARNAKTGDARISGTLASLIGLEAAMERQDHDAIERCIRQILLLHGIILSFGGIPLLYYGDEIGTINDRRYLQDPQKADDNRWLHRPAMNWDLAQLRTQTGSVPQRIFDGLKRMIAARKATPAFSDFNNREILPQGNPHVLAFLRHHPQRPQERVIVLANFDEKPQTMALSLLQPRWRVRNGSFQDLVTHEIPARFDDQLVLPPFRFFWLQDEP
jgi:amylosucrase